MAFSYACLTLQRVVVPTVLILAALYRPVGISFVYLLMFFISPFIPIANRRNFRGSVSAYFIILIALSTILLLCHITLQVTALALKISTIFGTCSFTEQLLRHVGFIDFQNLKPFAIFEWLLPEVVVFITSVAVYIFTKNVVVRPASPQNEDGDPNAPRLSIESSSSDGADEPNFDGLIKISPLFCLAMIFLIAVLRPSVPGGFYFLIFLLSGSYWATFKTLKRGFALLLRVVMAVIIVQSLCFVAYQTPWMQQHLDSDSLIARLIGLEPLVISTCGNDIRIIVYNTAYKFDSFLNPNMLFFTYYALALTTRNLNLVRHSTRKANREAASDDAVSEGSDVSDIKVSSNICDQICYGFISIGGFIYQNSYIFTNISMMTWAIIYHSWLTFALLLWANILWMIPNQRKSMMRSSPFIVIYAEILLIAQYIYGINLKNDELPSKVETAGINLVQIGLERPQENGMQPCVPLIVKTAFLLMFWVTSRQFFKEKKYHIPSTKLHEMIAPLHLTLGTKTDGTDTRKTSKFLKKSGDVIKYLLVRLWIWLLVLVIFLCAITGKHITGFRICYMALFLFFLLVFQSSSKVWVKVMYGFWLFLIFYAMSILILIYTYQFDKFDKYWNDYLNVSETLQKDIGLEQYKTKDLFLHLVSPTLIVILTVIQVHYFHRRFIASLQDPLQYAPRGSSLEIKSGDTVGVEIKKSLQSLQQVQSSVSTDAKKLLRSSWKRFKHLIRHYFKITKQLFWRFLELHIIKAVYITAFVCCVSEICVLHVLFAGLCIIGIISRSSVQIFVSRIISFVVSLIILVKMIYQVNYLHHDDYDIACKQSNLTGNNAYWFGLEKASVATGGLIGLLKKYIIYMIMVTLHAVVSLRQYQMHIILGDEPEPSLKVLFPSITRKNAEKNLRCMVKYLFNYAFFKFGIEITLISLVATITYRQDVVSALYSVWLAVLLCFNRSKCSRIWGVFQLFVALSIFIQYVVLVGLPPSLCLVFPWIGSRYSSSIQSWAMLPGENHINHSTKLVFDYLLLIFINRQKRVFYTESLYKDREYPGGTNNVVVNDIANLGKVDFVNPTHDFLSHVRNYLDVLMYAILCGFFWLTLAVVFLAGTNISDLLALGYLIGAFIFLWEGSDFYLRPIHTIINRWRWLLVFNVANIVGKTCFEMAGCLFLEELTSNCCWLVHMLGITCAFKQQDINSKEIIVSGECPALTRTTVLLWDAICFAFLIFQLRIFKSHFFCHIIVDTKANSILATRGADIIEDLRQKQIEHRKDHENEVLRKIKRKMERIRATQQKMLKPIDKPTHFDEYGNPVPGSKGLKRKELKLHGQAVRAGDYYMFDDMDEKFELDMIEDERDYLEDHDKSEQKLQRRKTIINTEQTKARLPEKPKEVTPSTSKEPLSEEAPEQKQKTDGDTVDAPVESDDDLATNPIVRLLEGFLVSMTIGMHRFSRNYRYVNKILSNEKMALKETKNIHRLLRPGAAALFASMRKNVESEGEIEDGSAVPSSSSSNALDNTQQPPQNISNTNANTTTTATTSTTTTSANVAMQMQMQSTTSPTPPEQSQQSQDPHIADITELPFDTVDVQLISANNILEDDFTTREHHIIVEFLMSAWFALLSNTDIICYLIVFINQVVNASIISLPLPLMVFLWGTLSLPRPTKTFWVTLIAYTQAIVLIKCIFQYKLIWSNYINLPNQPLAPAKIFGVELNPNYASYDLLLLLVLFSHRFILKQHGLWKSEYKDTGGLQQLAYKDDREEGGADIPNADNNRTGEERTVEVNASEIAEQDQNIGKDKKNSEEGSIASDTAAKYVQQIKRLRRAKYFSSLVKFFKNLVHKPRLPSDVYALMFLCDFINFFVLLFGYTAFGSQQSEGAGNGGVQTYLEENKVPIPFLIMLLVQFILIVIDRALYLRKALVNKIIFHFLSVIGIHIWMFFIVPAVTERSFYSLLPPIIFYIIKCFYLLLSSYQIMCGYPKRILGNFLTKGFSLLHMISFKVYMIVPFLYELRTILDWVCIDSTMTLFDWLKMEDIFSDIYFIKCSRQMESDFPAIRATKKPLFTKLILGGLFILMIVIAVWGPLCIFALANAVGQSNIPTQVSISIRIGSYDPIYETNTRDHIFAFDESTFSSMQNVYLKDKSAVTFLSGYDSSDIAAVRLPGNSPSLWNISPPDRSRLLEELKSNNTIVASFAYSITRVPPDKSLVGTVSAEINFSMNETFEGREAMVSMLEGRPGSTVVIPDLVPKFIKILNSGDAVIVQQLMSSGESYRPLEIIMHSTNDSSRIWWEIGDYCDDDFYKTHLSKLPMVKCNAGIVFYTFNDKKFPSTFSFFTKGGILGMYTTFVIVASRFFKSFMGGQNRKIMFEDMPYVDRVLQLCLDIYLVREALEFALEEDLFAKLIFLYRSPETMIKWTRPKEEANDDETDTESVRSRISARRGEQSSAS